MRRNFQAKTASLLRSSSLSRSLTESGGGGGGACFAIRERGELSLLENERRGKEGRKERRKEENRLLET